MADININKFVGKGLKFPIIINGDGRPDIAEGTDLINASIANILSFTVGTKFMLGEFGAKLEELLEEPNDNILKSLVSHFIIEALSKWEKRVEVTSVTLEDRDDIKIVIKITYKIINTKLEDTFVFPYYSQLKF